MPPRDAGLEHDETFTFGFRAVQDKAPKTSGVYAIYTSRQWLYVGESGDIQKSLYDHLNRQGCLARRGPLSFSFEVVAPGERAGRRQTLVEALAPVCNQPAAAAAIEPRS